MGDNLGPNRLSSGCRVLCSRSSQMPSSTSLMPRRWPASTCEMLMRVAVHADATAMGDQDLAVVQRIAALGQVAIANSLRRGVVAAQMVRAEPQPQRILGPLGLS